MMVDAKLAFMQSTVQSMLSAWVRREDSGGVPIPVKQIVTAASMAWDQIHTVESASTDAKVDSA